MNLPQTPHLPEYMTHTHIVFDMDELRFYILFRERLFEHYKKNSDKKTETDIENEIIGKTIKDADDTRIDEWENFTSYCIKCGKLKKIHNDKCDIDDHIAG